MGKKKKNRQKFIDDFMACAGAWADRDDLPDDPVGYIWGASGEYWKERHDNLLGWFANFMGEEVPPELSLIDHSPRPLTSDEIEYAKKLEPVAKGLVDGMKTEMTE